MNVLMDPTILFFIFGFAVAALGSTLEIPSQVSRFLGLYLLMSLGLKGGYSLSQTGITFDIVYVVAIALTLCIVIPLAGYHLLKERLGTTTAAAIAATYGSVSAVTYMTATQYLEMSGIPFDGYMSAILAIMEAPAIILALVLAKSKQNESITDIIGEAFKDGAPALLLASMLIAFIGGEKAHEMLQPFNFDIFKGMLCLFLLDMGLTAARSFKQADKSLTVMLYSIGAPLVHASIALVLCLVAGVAVGNTILVMVLAASASYIAAPAVLKIALPEANPGQYIGMSLGVTFPLNILIGIPLYSYIVSLF